MVEQITNELVTSKKTESLDEIREFVKSVTRFTGFSGRERRLISLAVETAATGIILNAREQHIKGELSVKIAADETRLRVEINDSGDVVPFGSPAEIGIGELINRLPSHSLGIFLIRRIMHEVEYEYKKGFISKLTMIRFRM
ncbi:MAG: ATP-binding protein [Planctomycetota bacterium]|nr:MAG: ATP-binding protein [Planctomycetota bacterium]